jgi:hypothetical protein
MERGGAVAIVLLLLSRGISLGMTIGAVSQTGLSGGCGRDEEGVGEQTFAFDFVFKVVVVVVVELEVISADSFICETSLLGDEGVIKSNLLLVLLLLLNDDIRGRSLALT